MILALVPLSNPYHPPALARIFRQRYSLQIPKALLDMAQVSVHIASSLLKNDFRPKCWDCALESLFIDFVVFAVCIVCSLIFIVFTHYRLYAEVVLGLPLLALLGLLVGVLALVGLVPLTLFVLLALFVALALFVFLVLLAPLVFA